MNKSVKFLLIIPQEIRMFNPFQIYKKLARENLQLKEKIYNLEKTGDGQKQTEDELRLMHRQLITVLDNIDSVVYIADMQTYELLFINE